MVHPGTRLVRRARPRLRARLQCAHSCCAALPSCGPQARFRRHPARRVRRLPLLGCGAPKSWCRVALQVPPRCSGVA